MKSIIALAGALCALALGSAYAEDNTTNIISGTTVDYGAAWYYVGESGTNNYLQIDSGGQLNNCAAGAIGYLAGASNNAARVTDSGSWNITSSTYVGYTDGHNSLVISNGGYVTSGNGGDGNIVGYGTNSANNRVLVTGANSTWDGSSTLLMIGNHGQNNSLTVADGGSVYVPSSSFMYLGGGTAGGNNHLLITDTNSAIYEGTSGFFETTSGNTVMITNGGAFYGGGSVFFGYGVTGVPANNNTNTITGAGSTWDLGIAANPFWLGYLPTDTGNILNVLNGATLIGQTLTVGGSNSVFNLGDGSAAQPTATLKYVNLGKASARMNINNGVFVAGVGIQTLIFGSGKTYIQSGGAVFDIQVGFTVGIKIPLLEDPASTGGGLTKIGSGIFFLAGTNTYTGATIVSNGTFLMDGALPSSTVTLISGTTLGGSGTIGTPVTIPAGTTLQPRDLSTLTINNTLNLAGTNVMVLNRTNTQNASKISGVTTLTQGGTLTVVNAGDPLQLGDTFTLFSASTVNGSFATKNLPSLAAGLQWNFSGRVLSVAASVNPNPTNIVYSVSGGNLTLTWPGDYLGWYAQSNSVNVANSSDWHDIAGSQNATNLIITINPAQSSMFYRLRLP